MFILTAVKEEIAIMVVAAGEPLSPLNLIAPAPGSAIIAEAFHSYG